MIENSVSTNTPFELLKNEALSQLWGPFIERQTEGITTTERNSVRYQYLLRASENYESQKIGPHECE